MTSKARSILAFSGVFISAILLLFTVVMLSSGHVEAAPATFTVTNINDSGAGSLRAAIVSANSNGNPGDQDQITFNISGAGDQIIELQSALNITQSVKIDGLTQGDATANTNNWPAEFNGTVRIGIDNTDSGSLVITADNVSLVGMAIYGAPQSDIVVDSADNFEMKGVYLNADTSGLRGKRFFAVDGSGWLIASHPALHIIGSSNAVIGGSNPQDRNILAYCVQACIRIEGTDEELASGALIQGNYFGVGADGLSSMSSNAGQDNISRGIELLLGADNTTIGGYATPSEGNTFFYISGFPVDAQDVDGTGIYGNHFNITKGITNMKSADIRFRGVTNSEIGSADEPYSKNVFVGAVEGTWYSVLLSKSDDTNMESQNITIAENNLGVLDDDETIFTGASVIYVTDSTSNVLIQSNLMRGASDAPFADQGPAIMIDDNAQKVSIISNSIYDYHNALGIDILEASDAYGRNLNDELDIDEGPNDLLNAPGYTYIAEDGGDTSVDFTLDVPAGDYRIEFFSNTLPDPGGYGEGEMYLGFQDITHDGEGLQEFSTILSGTGHTNLALTATEIDPSTPSGFGATSEFGAEGEPYIPPPPTELVQDLAVRSYLVNPQDYAIGNTLNYNYRITNYGPDTFDLSILNEVIPVTNASIGYFISPANLTNATTDSDVISCQYFGDGSALTFGPMLANHSDFSVTSCGYTGVGPRLLTAGSSIEFTLSYTVLDDNEASFGMYGFINPNFNDPDVETLGPLGEGAELLDHLSGAPINNFSIASSTPADLSVEKTLLTEGKIEAGQQVQYRLTVKNNGASPFDIGQLDGSGNPFLNSLLLDILPPNVAYDSQDNTDFGCTWLGPGSASLAGPLLEDHSDYSLLLCTYIGINSVLAAGEEVSTVITATAITTQEDFTNYLITFGSYNDPDFLNITSDMVRGYELITNALSKGYNNAVLAAYTDEPEVPSGGGGGTGNSSGGQANVGSTGGSLSDTGSKNIIVIPAILFVVSVGLLVFVLRQDGGRTRKLGHITLWQGLVVIVVSSGLLLGYGVWPHREKQSTKVIYDVQDKQQDPEEGLLNIPKDATSRVCDAVPATLIESVLGVKTKGARVSIPTTITKEGSVSACAYIVDRQEKSDVESVIISRREFTSEKDAINAFETLDKISSRKRTNIDSSAFFEQDSGQLVMVKDSALTTVSIARNGSIELKESLFKQLFLKLSQ